MNDKVKEDFCKPIFVYTSEEAEEDGILFDITKINPDWKKGMFNYVTTNLLNKGYFVIKDKLKGEEISIPNLLDLLNQANEIVKKKSKNFTEFDSFFSGEIELPSGEKQEVYIEQNETGKESSKFTILLPEDH